MSRNSYRRASSRLICFSVSWRSVAKTSIARDARPLSCCVQSRAIDAHFAIAASPAFLPRHLLNVAPHCSSIHALYEFPQSSISWYDAIFAFKSRSALISIENNLYSSPLHVTLRRHASILSPQIVSPSPAHFVKFEPHFSCIHARRPLSQLLRPAVADCVFLEENSSAAAASSAARCARIKSAKLCVDASVAPVVADSKIASNCDVLSSIISSDCVLSVSVVWLFVLFTELLLFVLLFVVVFVLLLSDGTVESLVVIVGMRDDAGRGVVAAVADGVVR